MAMQKMLTKTVRMLQKPNNVTVCLSKGFRQNYLSVVYGNSETRRFPISVEVAEVLCAFGVPYQS